MLTPAVVPLVSSAPVADARYVFRIGSNLLADRWQKATPEASWLDRLRGTTDAHAEPVYDDSVSRELLRSNRVNGHCCGWPTSKGESHERIATALGLSRGRAAARPL